jgi:hypothetical protein
VRGRRRDGETRRRGKGRGAEGEEENPVAASPRHRVSPSL